MKQILKTTLLVAFIATISGTVEAQDLTKKYGTDSVECLTQLSLYREVYKQKNYKDAYASWKWVKDNCPLSSKYIFTNGPVILEYFIDETKEDSLARDGYIKELFDLLDLRIKCYPADEGYTLGRIGIYLWKYYPTKEYKKVLEVLGQSMDLEGTETSPQVLDIYFKVSEYCMKKEKLNTEVLIDAYDKITEILNVQMDTCELKHENSMRKIYQLREKLDSGLITQEDYEGTLEYLHKDSSKTANELDQYERVSSNLDLRFSNYAQCDVLLDIYGKKLEASKDERLLRQIIKFLGKQNCIDNDVFVGAVEEMYKIRPNANTAFFMGQNNYKNRNYNGALNYFNEAVDMYEKESDKIKTYVMIAECQKSLGQMSAARETAYKIAKMNPGDGRAYLIIGDLYAASASSCAGDLPAAVYWAAADKYAKAKAIDPSRAEEAQKRINTVSGRFPSTASYFNLGLQKGSSYRIGCWINESTTIR